MSEKKVYLYGEPGWSRGFHVVPNVYPVRCAGSGSQLLIILYTTPHFGGRGRNYIYDHVLPCLISWIHDSETPNFSPITLE